MKSATVGSSVVLLAGLLAGCSSAPPPRQRRPAAKPSPTVAQKKSKRPRGLPEGAVVFTVEDADLKTEVLPLFADQVGVRILWHGEPRRMSLRLTQPIRWRDALDLVCQFTRTHATQDYQGRVVLKDGWGGSLGADTALPGVGVTVRSSGTSGSSSGSSGGSSASAGSSTSGGAYAGSEATDIMRGITTTNSGSR